MHGSEPVPFFNALLGHCIGSNPELIRRWLVSTNCMAGPRPCSGKSPRQCKLEAASTNGPQREWQTLTWSACYQQERDFHSVSLRHRTVTYSGTVMRSEAIQVVTTTAEKKDAEALAQAVLQRRLGACVQLSGPIESRYWWNSRIETANEWIVAIKTRRDLYKPLEKLLLDLHPYDQPEIIATPIVEISAGYWKWLNEQVDAGKATT